MREKYAIYNIGTLNNYNLIKLLITEKLLRFYSGMVLCGDSVLCYIKKVIHTRFMRNS